MELRLRGAWSLDCSLENLRQSLSELGFDVPRIHAEVTSAALGDRYSPAQVLAEGYARVEWQLSNRYNQEALRLAVGYPAEPSQRAFEDLGPEAADDLHERISEQKLREASQTELGLENVVDKKGLKAYCKIVAKNHGYKRPSASLRGAVLLEKQSKNRPNISVGLTLDAGGSHTQLWATTAAQFFFVHDTGETLPQHFFFGFPGLISYHSARPSARELQRLRFNPDELRAPVASMKQLNDFYALHPRTTKEVSDELKLSVAARFTFVDLLLEHIDFEASAASGSSFDS